jgi:hypothetical protein
MRQFNELRDRVYEAPQRAGLLCPQHFKQQTKISADGHIWIDEDTRTGMSAALLSPTIQMIAGQSQAKQYPALNNLKTHHELSATTFNPGSIAPRL